MTGNVFGSPRYTSPEQVMGRPIDGRSDIFSLGAVLFEMLTGHSAFVGSDLNGILKQVLTDPTPPPSSHNPKLPRAFDHIVGKALAKDPAERYQDADDMARDLRRYDRVDLDTSAPAPLPALEHPTNPKAVPAPDIEDTPLTPILHAAGEPWWKRKVVWSTAVAAVVVVALTTLLVPRKATVPATAASMLATSGSIAPAPAAASPSPAAAYASAPSPAPPAAMPPPVASPPSPAATPAPKPLQPAAAAVAGQLASVASTAAAGKVERAPASPAAAETVAAIAPPVPAPPKPTGRIVLAVQPWGEIYVDGKKRGISPPTKELRLPPGQHVVEIRNGAFPAHSETVQVNADESVRITHNF